MKNTSQAAITTAKAYAPLIIASLGKHLDAVLATGRLLIQAKAELKHGEWGKLFDGPQATRLLPISWRTADYMMAFAKAVAEHPSIWNSQFRTNLPASPTMIFYLLPLLKLDDVAFLRAMKTRDIFPEMNKGHVERLIQQTRKLKGSPTSLVEATVQAQRLRRTMKGTGRGRFDNDLPIIAPVTSTAPVVATKDKRYHIGEAVAVLKTLPDDSVDTCVTSPPYFAQRGYGDLAGQIGGEKTVEDFIANLVAVFAEVRRVLKPTGSCWIVMGDTYAGGKKRSRPNMDNPDAEEDPGYVAPGIPGDLIGVPWLLAFALKKDGWILRGDQIWAKPNGNPDAATNRCARQHDYVFHFTKKATGYLFSMNDIMEPATTVEGNKNKGSVWTVPVNREMSMVGHPAMYPESLIEPCIKATCPRDGVVLDPFMGTGTTAVVAEKLGCDWLGIDLNPAYAAMAEERLASKAKGPRAGFFQINQE